MDSDVMATGKLGSFSVSRNRLLKMQPGVSRNEEDKNNVIEQITERCVDMKLITVMQKDAPTICTQTENVNKAKRRCIEKRDPAEIETAVMKPAAPLDDVIVHLAKQPALSNIGQKLTVDSVDLLGSFTREKLRAIIQNSKKVAEQENRKRVTPSDVDVAVGILDIKYDLACPLLKATPATDRMYWGRKFTKPRKTIEANAKEMVGNEKFCDSIYIKDHWLVVEGIQPCVPENVVPSEVRQKFQEELRETQRLHGYGPPGVKRDTLPEKRISTQTFSMEHQVLYSEVTNILTSGSPLSRRRVLDCLETDTGIQFLAGRFVILIAEGVRLHIGSRNVRGLCNLMKLTWSLMKNPNIRLEKYLYVLVPSLISCVVSKSIVPVVDSSKLTGMKGKSTVPPGASELTEEDNERIMRDLDVEFRLREAAGRILALLSEQYQSQNLNMRIIQTLRKVLSGNHDPTTIYGVLCTFFAFGNLTIETILLPKMHDIFCSLKDSRSDVVTVKTTMTRLRKIVVESEIKRMEFVQNRTIELMIKIIYENELYNERKLADRDAYKDLYAEFGAIFYDYAFNNGMIDESNGRLKATRPSLLLHRKSFLQELEQMKKKKTLHQIQPVMNDEAMLDNLLDDSHRPWVKAAAHAEEAETSAETKEAKPTFFRSPKLFLVRKEKSAGGGWSTSYIRPLEYGYMPILPTTRGGRRIDPSRETIVRDSFVGQSVYASRASESVKSSRFSEELLKRFVNRPKEQAGAIVYGRNMTMSESGKSTLEAEIAKAAAQLSGIRLANAVSTSRSVFHKDEMSRGKFLTRPQTLHNS